MITKSAHSTQTSSLAGTTWTYTYLPQGTQGTFEYKAGHTGVYTAFNKVSYDFYWWQHGNSFWMQVQDVPGYMVLIEGELTGIAAGTGRFVDAIQGHGYVDVAPMTMTLNE